MPGRVRGTRRGTRLAGWAWRVVVAISLAVALAGCSVTQRPPSGTDPATGFPVGVFSKVIDRPDTGRTRLDWVFGPDGRWAEVPFALDGQPQPAPAVRGTYRVDGDTLTIAISWPTGSGTSQHRWRRDGDALWTVFVSSDNADDLDWFTSIDSMPWRPAS